jgi:hypothetical protein
MSRNEAPALVSSASDIVEYYVSDASPVEPNAPPGFIERYIHSEILKRFSGISTVVHSVVGFRGPLQNHMVRTTVVPLRRIGIFGQLCS